MAEKGGESVADAEGFAVLALKENVFKCLIRRSAASAREVAAGEGSGAGSEWVGDTAHAHEGFGVLKFVEAAGS